MYKLYYHIPNDRIKAQARIAALNIRRIGWIGVPFAGGISDPVVAKIGWADRHLAMSTGQVDDIGRLSAKDENGD